MTDRRALVSPGEQYPAPWPSSFRERFLLDFAQFVRDPAGGLPSPAHVVALAPQDYLFFTTEVPHFIRHYVNQCTAYKPPPPYQGQSNYPMERFILQNDDPFTGHSLSMPKGDQASPLAAGVEDIPGLGNSRDFILQAQRDVHWPAGEYSGMGAGTTKYRNSNLVKTVATSSAVLSIESGVRDLRPAAPPPRKGALGARSLNGIENPDCREGSSANEGCAAKRIRQGKYFANSSERVPLGRRSSESSKVSSSRREAKTHVCEVCHKDFPFKARLRSHMAIHIKEKIRCLDCGSEFGRDSSLKRHRNTVGSCNKKKQAKIQAASIQGGSTMGPGSNNNFEGDATTSRGSCRESDNVSVDNNPPDTEYGFVRPRNFAGNDYALISPGRLHNLQYGHDRAMGPQLFQHFSSSSHNPHRPATSPQAQGDDWPGFFPSSFGDFLGCGNDGD